MFSICTRKAAVLNMCPWGKITMKFKICFFQNWVINLITQRLLRFQNESLGIKSRRIKPFNLHGLKSGHGSRTMRRRIKRFAVCIKAVQQERVRNCALTSKTSDAFLTRGFTNGKMQLERSTEGSSSRTLPCKFLFSCCSLIVIKYFA